jgi:branched-chain amino acid transport system substrate-binding protein
MLRSLILLALLCVSCGSPSVEEQTGPGEADQLANISGEEIKIGAFLALSGKNPRFLELRDGALLAVEELNAAGGLHQKQNKKLSLVLVDDLGNVEGTRAAVERLIKEEKVVALVGEAISTLSIEAATVAQQYRIPMITPSATDPEVTRKGPYIFRACFVDPFQGKALAKFATSSLKAKTAAILIDNAKVYSQGLAAAFESEFIGLGGQVTVKANYITNDEDFSAQLDKIASAKPDVLFIPGYFSDVAVIAKQVKAKGITSIMLGGDGWDSTELLSLAGNSLEGAYFSTHYTTEDPESAKQKFVASFREKYKVSPTAQAALGYDSVMLLAAAMNQAKTLKPSDIRAALASLQNVQGVTGTISFDAQRNAKKDVAILQITENKYRLQTRTGTD